METRVAQSGQKASEMPGRLNFRNHVKKLTKECLRAFESNGDSKIAPNSNPFESILKDGLENCKDDVNSNEYPQDLIDGIDSGVEVIRALSSNGSNSDRYTPAQSCGSSLVSCYSEPEGDRASECGSDNSKDCRKVVDCGKKTDRSRTVCKRSDFSESCSENSSTCEGQAARISDLSQASRVQGRKSDAKQPPTRRGESMTRLASRDKSGARSQSIARAAGHQPPEKPKTRPKPGCKLDDGRWPSAVQKCERPRPSHLGDAVRKTSNVMSSSMMASSFKSPVENKSNALEKYGTLPRRPKRKSLENGEPPCNQALSLARSSSVSREPSLNRAATLRRQQSREKENIVSGKSLPPYPKTRKSAGKTVIYHEISIQTNITGEDIGNILAGRMPSESVISLSIEKANKAIQSEGREKLKELEEFYAKQSEELESERRENERLKQERTDMLVRICKILGYSEPKTTENGESELSELERHFQAVGLTVIKQQEELSKLRHFTSIMQRDLEKSFAAQKNLLQQRQDIEAEYFELQEFLQAEKTAVSEALKDTEAEFEDLKKAVSRKEEVLKQREEECKHLVRICEQRRQENLSLEAKLSGLEQRSRDVIVQQGAAVSGAAVALSGLGARLDSLVEQLAVSCNISEKDLEDVIYHNEAYTQGQSEDNSPDAPPTKGGFVSAESPKKGTSFLNAIMGALRSATQSPFSSSGKKNSVSQSQNDQSETLDLLEPESCLAMEENASSASHYTDCGSCSPRGELLKYDMCEDAITLVPHVDFETSPDLSRTDSIQNLSAAILARQEIEKIERNLSPDLIIPTEVNSLVDKVIDVDNLLTKLLKVLRIIQLENDVSVEQLEDQRLDLTEKLEQEQICRQKTEDKLQKLQCELKEARSQLSARIVQLEQAKMMLSKDARNVMADNQRQFAAIHNAIGTLQSIQDVVNQCPPLAKLQQDLQDYNYRSTSGDDLNANTAKNGNGNGNGNMNKVVAKRNGPVLSTAV